MIFVLIYIFGLPISVIILSRYIYKDSVYNKNWINWGTHDFRDGCINTSENLRKVKITSISIALILSVLWPFVLIFSTMYGILTLIINIVIKISELICDKIITKD